MPKIFALRHQLAEQQAKLKHQAKTGVSDDHHGSGPAPGGSGSGPAVSGSEDMPLDLGMPKVQQMNHEVNNSNSQEQGKILRRLRSPSPFFY